MNLREILKDPEAAIMEVWQSIEDCPHSAQITSLTNKIKAHKKELKDTKKVKQELASKFKTAKGNPELLDELKLKMQDISTRLNTLESEQKELGNELQDYFSQQECAQVAPFPRRFEFGCKNRENAQEPLSVSLADSEEAWDAYANTHPNASAYHAYAWKTVIEKSFGHQCPYLIAKNSSDNVVGILPLVAFSSQIFGRYAVSIPYFNYGGPLGDSNEVIRALIDHAEILRTKNKWKHIEYRCCENNLSLPCESRKASMILALPENMSILEETLGAKVRAQYKQTEKINSSTHFGGIELLDDFYKIFAQNMRDLGTPVYSKLFFRNILLAFPNQTTLVIAKINDRSMGAAFLFGYKDMLEIPWASTLRKANKYNLNMWMYRNILAFAIDRKYSYFDFGRSTINAGTYRFKKQWGAEPLKHYWYYSMGEGEKLPQLNPDNTKYKLAIGVWKMLPVALTMLIGPPLVKNIP